MRSKKQHFSFKSKRNALFLRCMVALWILANLLLLVFALRKLPLGNRLYTFYPFNYNHNVGVWAYDITEFVSYSIILPFLLYHLFDFMWKHSKKRTQNVALFITIIYCLGFILLSFFYHPSMMELYISLLKATLNILLVMYFIQYVFKIQNQHKN